MRHYAADQCALAVTATALLATALLPAMANGHAAFSLATVMMASLGAGRTLVAGALIALVFLTSANLLARCMARVSHRWFSDCTPRLSQSGRRYGAAAVYSMATLQTIQAAGILNKTAAICALATASRAELAAAAGAIAVLPYLICSCAAISWWHSAGVKALFCDSGTTAPDEFTGRLFFSASATGLLCIASMAVCSHGGGKACAVIAAVGMSAACWRLASLTWPQSAATSDKPIDFTDVNWRQDQQQPRHKESDKTSAHQR